MAAKKSTVTKRSAPLKRAPPRDAALARLEAEKAALAVRLAAAEDRIAALERQRDEALNRIEWVIDSLHTMAEDTG
jgi:hypothetical protein